MTTTKAFVLYGLIIPLGLGLIVYSEELTDLWMEKTRVRSAKLSVGHFVSEESGGQIHHHGEKPRRIKKGRSELVHGDEMRIPRGQNVRIDMEGYELGVAGPAQWTFEKWNPNYQKSPIYITIIDGDFQMMKVGTKGMVYIVRDGRMYAPEMGAPSVAARTLSLPTQAISQDTGAPSEALTSVEDVPPPAPVVGTEKPASEETAPSEPKTITQPLPSAQTPGNMPDKMDMTTLSNEEISKTIEEKAHLFRRCQINSVRDQLPAEGVLLISMTIEPTGKVSQVRILQSQIQNPSLAECVQSVLNRTMFREFQGIPITVNYPLEFR